VVVSVVVDGRPCRDDSGDEPSRHCLLCCGLTSCGPCDVGWTADPAAEIRVEEVFDSRWYRWARSCGRHYTRLLHVEEAWSP
jgi:hypothetical protein